MPMVAASPEELHCGEAGAGGEEKEEDKREMADADARQFSDRELLEKAQRIQTALTSGVADRLRDRGRKLRATLDGIHREQERRKAHRGGARAPGNDRCERIVQSRCAESSGLPSGASRANVSFSDFKSSFGMDKKAGSAISSWEITSRSPNMPNTLIENEGKVCKEKDTCESSSQPTNSFHEELHLDTSANFEKTSSDDATNSNGHNRTCEATATASRKRKGADPVNFSMRLRSRKEEVVLLDGDVPIPKYAQETLYNWDAEKLYYPSREDLNSVEISSDDIRCLQPESLLSSPIMNFYIMYLQGPMSPIIRPSDEYHIFNTYFFSKLEGMTSKLRRWWKGVDIFQKAYILMPVHAESHWSLIIICMPAKENQTGPIILHLDSLKLHSSRLIFSVVSRFLRKEWNYLNENVSSEECPLLETVWKNLPRKVQKKTIEVPQQQNDYDCGLFVLYYMQRFIHEAPERFQGRDFSMFGRRWFPLEEPSKLRDQILGLLRSCKEAGPKNEVIESCGEAQPKNDATLPTMRKHLPEAVDVTIAEESGIEETCRELA